MEAIATKFKPILMYVNEKTRDMITEHFTSIADKLNNAIEEIQSILEIKLSDDEKVEALKQGIDYVTDRLREKFPYPDGDPETNMKLLGKDITELKPLMDNARSLIDNDHLELENGEFQLLEKGRGMIQEQCSLYTSCPKQNEILGYANEVCNIFNKTEFYDIQTLNQIERSVKIINLNDNSQKFNPNYGIISRMNELGKFTY